MYTLLVTYDLNKKGQNYTDLIKRIKEANSWCHPLESTWFVRSAKTASEYLDVLLPIIDSNDELAVLNVTGDAAAWYGLGKEVSDWLKENL